MAIKKHIAETGLFFLLILLFSLMTNAQVQILESNLDNVSSIVDYAGSTQPYYCQGFNSTISANISLVSIWLKRASGASGDSKVYIYSNDAATGYPAAVLSELNFNDPVDQVISSSFAWHNFTLPQTNINATAQYHLCMYNTQVVNYLHFYKNAANPYTKGYVTRNNANDSSWIVDASSDSPFIVYYDGTIPTPPSLTLTTNLTNNYNSSLYPFSFGIWANTMVNTTDLWNCSVYLNSTLNQTFYNVKLNQTVNTQKVNLTYAPLQVGYNVNVSCYNNLATSSFLRTNIYLDSIPPLITTDFINHSFFYLDVAAFISFNFSDPSNLFAYNVTLRDPNNEIRSNAFVQNLPGNNYVNHTDFIPDVVGNWTIQASAWDSHTQNLLKPLKIDTLANGFIVNNDLVINGSGLIVNNIKNETVSYWIPTADRYKFKATFADSALEHTFYVSSKKPLHYISWTEYKGHFVYDLNNENGGYWLDFQGNNIKSVAVKKINNAYEVKITLFNPSDEIELESLGSLNFENKVYTFEVISILQSTNDILTDIKEEMAGFRQDFKEVISMIGLVFIYITFLILGYWLVVNKNFFFGLSLIGLTIGFDLFFYAYFYDTLIGERMGTTWQGTFTTIFAYSFVFWIMIKVLLPVTYRYMRTKVNIFP